MYVNKEIDLHPSRNDDNVTVNHEINRNSFEYTISNVVTVKWVYIIV